MKIKPTHELSFEDLVDKYGGNIDLLAQEFLSRHLSATEESVTAEEGGSRWLQSLLAVVRFAAVSRVSFEAVMNRLNGQEGILRAIHPKQTA